ncbi:hypothetical protein ACFW04_014424 [Cataglyphis niger]
MYSTEGSNMNYYVPIENVKIPLCKKECDKISVGAMSCVQLVLNVNHGNQIVLPFETWKSLMQKCADIERLLQTSQPPLQI